MDREVFKEYEKLKERMDNEIMWEREFDKFRNGLQRYLVLDGMTVTPLPIGEDDGRIVEYYTDPHHP